MEEADSSVAFLSRLRDLPIFADQDVPPDAAAQPPPTDPNTASDHWFIQKRRNLFSISSQAELLYCSTSPLSDSEPPRATNRFYFVKLKNVKTDEEPFYGVGFSLIYYHRNVFHRAETVLVWMPTIRKSDARLQSTFPCSK